MEQEDIKEIFFSAISAVDPATIVTPYCNRIESIYKERRCRQLYVAGFGKAAVPMAVGVSNAIGNLVTEGIVIAKYGHNKIKRAEMTSKIAIREAAHPLPDENGISATREIAKLLKKADKNTLVVCLISGGASALLVMPYGGITLSQKKDVTRMLLNAGATIDELNTVRKHISEVKGGKLANIAYPASIVSLVLSDVIGDRVDVIASGPTSPDKSTYQDAIEVLNKYGLTYCVPDKVLEVLKKGARGIMHETPKEGSAVFEKVENIVIGSNKIALCAAKEKASTLGYRTQLLSSSITGESRLAGRLLAQKAKDFFSTLHGLKTEKVCLVSGGETTVAVKGSGIGGRNMELALAFAMEIEGMQGITLLSAGTDGTDGPTDAAGAIVDGKTIIKARRKGIDPNNYLVNNDSYNFFDKIGGLFITGATGTNVMDIQIIIIKKI